MHTSTQTHRHSRTSLGLLRTHALTRSSPIVRARRSESHSNRVVLQHGTEVRWHGVDHGKERPWAAWRWHDDEQSRLRAGQRVVWSVWQPRFCRVGPNIAHTLEHTRSLWTSSSPTRLHCFVLIKLFLFFFYKQKNELLFFLFNIKIHKQTHTHTHTRTHTPTAMLAGIKAIDGDWAFSMALKTDGTVWVTGKNNAGQLGDGTTTDKRTFAKLSGVSGQFQSATTCIIFEHMDGALFLRAHTYAHAHTQSHTHTHTHTQTDRDRDRQTDLHDLVAHPSLLLRHTNCGMSGRARRCPSDLGRSGV